MSFIDEVVHNIVASPFVPEHDKRKLPKRMTRVKAFSDKLTEKWPSWNGTGGGQSGTMARDLYSLMAKSQLVKLNPESEIIKIVSEVADQKLLSPEEVYRWGLELDRLSPRIPGTVNMDRANDYIIEKLRSFGLDAWDEPMNFKGVFFHDFGLTLLSPEHKEVACFPQNNVGFGDVTADLVDVGKGLEKDYTGKDVEGKIVLVNWGSLWDHEGPCAARLRYTLLRIYDIAFANKAAGMVGYFEDAPGNTLKVIEPGFKPVGGSNVWGPAEAGPDRQYKLMAVNIGREDALALKALAGQGPLKVRLAVKGVRKVSTTGHVVAVLPGKSDRTLLIGSHSCTAFEGAICDTSGTVGALALARYFSLLPLEKREKTMVFYFDSFHVWGNCCQAGLMFIKKHSSTIPNIDAMIWLDHISSGESQARVTITSGNPAVWPLAALAMAGNGRMPLALPIARSYILCMPGAFERLGIPVVTQQAIDEPMLTTEDTWDKFTPGSFYKDVLVHVDLALWLHKLAVPRDEPGEPLGGCGVLFTETDTPEYSRGEAYVPEPAPPLYVGGNGRPVSILRTQEEKDAYLGL